MNMKIARSLLKALGIASLLSAAALSGIPSRGGENPGTATASTEEFFIISSVDAQKQRIVVKRPTEVTELLQVNEKTVYQDEQGKAIEFKSLRAGDTVYVMSSRGPEGTHLAIRIRKGPMTVEELHRRYVPFQ